MLDLVEPFQYLGQAGHRVVHRIQADQRIPAAVTQSLEQGGRDALHIVRGVVRLKPGSQGPPQADGGIAVGRHPDLGGRVDQVQIAHQLRHRRHHLRGQRLGYPPDILLRGLVVQNPLPQLRYRPAPYLPVNGLVDAVLVEPGHLVLLVGDHRVLPELTKQHIRQHLLGRDPFDGGGSRHPGQHVPGFLLIGLGQHFFYGLEGKYLPREHRPITHIRNSLLSFPTPAAVRSTSRTPASLPPPEPPGLP